MTGNRTIGRIDVLVVGGRTTGLMLAIRLRRQGLGVRIVDGSPGIDPHSRATLLHARSLELLENLGVTEEVVAKGRALRGMRLFADGQFVMETEDPPVESPYPYGIAYSQVRIERLLQRKLGELGVEVEREVTLLRLEQDDERVRAHLRHRDGGETVVEATWLVGCDGAHSTTRHLLGIGFPGTQSRYPYILGDVMAENDAPSDAWFYFLHREGSLIFAILDGGRRQIFGNLPEDHPAQGEPSLAELQEVVDRRTQGDYRLSDPRWLTYFHISYRLAERYRKGRVFLAGDAAHLNSLVGGHGMNTGIQDACNLAWKLALASRGLSSPALLDSYEAERRPVAAAMIDGSRAFTEPGELYPAMSAAERDAFFASFKMSGEELTAFRRNFEELDLDYEASPLTRDDEPGLPADIRPGLEAHDVGPLLIEGERRDLFHFLGGPNHCLLVFAGQQGRVAEAIAKAREALATCASWMDVHAVIPHPAGSFADGVSLLGDPEGRVTHRYGMSEGGLYLIRPDGYVAYRTTRLEGLETYVGNMLSAR
jgi:2-polyprenyl-6-methoxyphenol hydroxylase-like FAD-dependent oxidoreductase